MKRRGVFFEGWYFKHQVDSRVFSFIVSHHRDETGTECGWIQMITPDNSYCKQVSGRQIYTNPKKLDVMIDGSHFSLDRICGAIDFEGCTVIFDVKYRGITPLEAPAMGPFRFLPAMECRHEVYSLTHQLKGFIQIDGVRIDLSEGIGYIEGDRGTSFPKSYFWSQCNFYKGGDNCVMVAVADIPLPIEPLHFRGTLCAIYYRGKHYRLATYYGAKILVLTPHYMRLEQGNYQLKVSLIAGEGHPLKAPKNGEMSVQIMEKPVCTGRYTFYEGGEILFDVICDTASGEYYEA